MRKILNLVLIGLFLLITKHSAFAQPVEDSHAIHAHYIYDKDSIVYMNEDSTLYYSIENLGSNINSAHLESGPRISPDGKTLYFFRADHPENIVTENQDIWVSHLGDDDSTWSKAEHITALNNHDDNGIHWISADGKRVLLLGKYNKNGTSNEGISLSEHTGDGDDEWSFPKQVKVKKYKNDERSFYYMTEDENVMIMAIHHKLSIGHQDLFVSFKKKKGKKEYWTHPVNMGKTINTENHEATVFIDEDGKTMYFSSDGHGNSIGGFDIYKTTRLDSSWTKWSKPENIGSPFNTPDDEFYFSTPKGSDYAYLAHHFLGPDSLPHSDIVRIKQHEIIIPDPILVVKGKVFDVSDSSSIAATITVTKIPGDETFGDFTSDADTGYKVTLPAGDVYVLNFDGGPDYIPKKITVSAEDIEDFEEREIDVYLKPIKKDFKFEVENIFFAYNKADILQESYPALDSLVDVLKTIPNIVVELSAHTDARGSDSYNQKLSQRRAQSVVDYLVSKGILDTQLKAVGYGEKQIRNQCKNGVTCTDEEHKLSLIHI